MTTRDDLVTLALHFDGVDDGHGYDCANPFSADLGRPTEAWCGDYATDVFKRVGLALPSMQVGCRTGFAYVPDAWDLARAHDAVKPSWEAAPADLSVWDWNGDGTPDHVEPVVHWANGILRTIGGNSGASNVNGYHGLGGVHQHDWAAPAGQGNRQCLGIIDTSRFVHFGAAPILHRPAPVIHTSYRWLMLKSPLMHGSDVAAVEQALAHRGFPPANSRTNSGWDGVYGRGCRDAVMEFQRHEGIGVDGIVGPDTRAHLGLPT